MKKKPKPKKPKKKITPRQPIFQERTYLFFYLQIPVGHEFGGVYVNYSLPEDITIRELADVATNHGKEINVKLVDRKTKKTPTPERAG